MHPAHRAVEAGLSGDGLEFQLTQQGPQRQHAAASLSPRAYGVVVHNVNVSVFEYAPVRSASPAPMCCLNAIVTASLDDRRRPGRLRERDLQRRRQRERAVGQMAGIAHAQRRVTGRGDHVGRRGRVVVALHARGERAEVAAAPSVSDSVAGTEPPTSPGTPADDQTYVCTPAVWPLMS